MILIKNRINEYLHHKSTNPIAIRKLECVGSVVCIHGAADRFGD
jgi:hypothetical protein